MPVNGRRTSKRAAVGIAVGAVLSLMTVVAPGTAAWGASGPSYEVIASGLNNPRQITATSDGSLYVAEAGVGAGATPNTKATCVTTSAAEWNCAGTTGSVARVIRTAEGWSQDEVLTGLPSLAANGEDAKGQPNPQAQPGSSATGPTAVVVDDDGSFVLSMGLGMGCGTESGPKGPSPVGPDPSCHPRADHGLSPLFGTLLSGSLSSGKYSVLADLSAHEWVTNPVDNPDSNPGGLVHHGGRYVVADAGANTLLAANPGGHVKTLAQFKDEMVTPPPSLHLPPGATIPMQQVPTGVVWHDGAYYVSALTGFPFPKGGASIYKVAPGHAPTVYASGLTNVTGLAFGPDGTLYAVEVSASGLASGGPPIGAVMAIPAGGGSPSTVAGGLFAPYGIAIVGGAAYVTTGAVLPGRAPNPTPTTSCNGSTCAGGEVVRIPLSTTTSPLSITTTRLPHGKVGKHYSTQLHATGGAAFYTWAVTDGNLPDGLALSEDGTLSGTPTSAGTSHITVEVTDADGHTATATLAVAVVGHRHAPLKVTTSHLPDGTVGAVYSANLSATGGADTDYHWQVAKGALPPGLSLSSDGVISGTPTQAGTYTFTASVNDPATARLQIRIHPQQAAQTTPTQQLPTKVPAGLTGAGQPGSGHGGGVVGGFAAGVVVLVVLAAALLRRRRGAHQA